METDEGTMEQENPYQSPGADADWRDVDRGEDSTAADINEKSFALFTSCENISEAQLYQALLSQHGIDSYLENANAFAGAYSAAVGGIKIYVLASTMEEAITLFKNGLPKPADSGPAESITFECEDCGAQITFPGERRGKTETCPKCHEYVDVPD